MIIPADKLSPEALQGLIEEFITREGTDYGVNEVDLVSKVSQVKAQLQRGEVVIVFDEAQESVSMMTARQAQFVERELQNARSVEDEWQEYGGC
ncbi:YheU family protein [Pseudomaricurvus alkylphenolicus]|uniref:YheU family protein n=1 Tax=Pseudomaricurvus alkylphenolicus TaxID=1306991 RepID=UPI00141EF13B|nr:YheU family protein [Pseudomaricurvus alkylphenolicus]